MHCDLKSSIYPAFMIRKYICHFLGGECKSEASRLKSWFLPCPKKHHAKKDERHAHERTPIKVKEIIHKLYHKVNSSLVEIGVGYKQGLAFTFLT